MIAPEPELARFIQEQGLADAGEEGSWTPLTGGVSSDIWRVETGRGSFCVKRALAKLRVTADWEASVERNAYEWAYMGIVQAVAPGSVPTPIAHDEQRGLFAMAWLAPDRHKLWKDELLAGRVDPAVAGAVGDLLGIIHAATARDATLPVRFATDANFHALRIDPYLLEVARRHPEIASRIEAIARRTVENKRALVHGDVSPKNILLGPAGPVLLDAEVAWWGDPAFDLAFCLNHLAIKARLIDGATAALTQAGDGLCGRYLARVVWEDRGDLEARAAALLPVLALARVDGKSPVEYLDDAGRASLREDAVRAVRSAPATLAEARALIRSEH